MALSWPLAGVASAEEIAKAAVPGPCQKADFEAVVDAARLERFAILGMSQGAAVAIAYAVRHPERVSHLILYGGYLRGMLRRDPTPTMVEEAGVMRKLMELGWGREDSAFRQVFATQFVPDSTLEHLQRYEAAAEANASLAEGSELDPFTLLDTRAVLARSPCIQYETAQADVMVTGTTGVTRIAVPAGVGWD